MLPPNLIIWASCKPVIKLFLVIGTGLLLAKKGVLTPQISKSISQVLLLVGYPSLMFVSVVTTITDKNLTDMGILTMFAVLYVALGCVFGILIVKVAAPPFNFRNSTVKATSMGNWGDLTLAIITGVGNQEPFNNGDASIGVAYVSAFRIFANLYLNTVGFAYIGKDFMVCLPIDKRDGIPLETTTPPASSLTRKLSIIKTQKTLVLGSSADVDDFASSEENSDQLVAANIGGLEKLVVMNEIKDSCSPRLSKRFSNSINPSPPSVLPPSARSSPTLSATALNIPNNSTPSRFAQIKNTMIPNWLLNPGPNTKMWINAFKNPSFFAVILGLIIATSASLKHLFVSLNAVPGQPLPIGSEPVLQVLTEFFTFLGQFAVPIGLLNLGAALGRLSVKTFFSWKVILSIAFSRLVLLPVIGITLVQVLTYHASLIDPNDKMLRFVLMLQAAVPTASSAVFFTQYHHPRGEANEMAAVVLVQYILAFFTLTGSLVFILSMVSDIKN